MKSPFPVGKAETEFPNPIASELWNVVGNVSVYCRMIVLFEADGLLIRAGRRAQELIHGSLPAVPARRSDDDHARSRAGAGRIVGEREASPIAGSGADEHGIERRHAREIERCAGVIQCDGVRGVGDQAAGELPGRVDGSRRSP